MSAGALIVTAEAGVGYRLRRSRLRRTPEFLPVPADRSHAARVQRPSFRSHRLILQGREKGLPTMHFPPTKSLQTN